VLLAVLSGAAASLGAPPPASALDPGKAVTQYLHDVWQTEQGLPQNTVNAIAETPDGYLWLGTREGLARFDGVRFTLFDTRSVPELGHNFVLALLSDSRGRLWIGNSGGGLVRLEAGRFTRYAEANGLPSEQVTALFEDRKGRLWVGTDGGGLARLERDRFVREPSRESLGKSIRALVEDDSGLWIASDEGLACLRNGILTSFTTEQGLSRRSVRSLLKDRAGSLWIGTDQGLNRLEDGRFSVFTTREGLSHDVVVSLREDRDGVLWIGTDGGGLTRLANGRFSVFSTRQGLSNDSVFALHEDREGSLWIGTNLGGLNRLRDGRFTAFTTREGLSHDFVRAIYEDRAGTLWVATEGGGVNRLQDDRTSSFNTRNGLSNDTVFALLEDRRGDLWIGTDSGLNRLRAGRLDIFTANMGLSNDCVLSLLEDHEGSLWIGTYAEGLNRLKDGRFTTFTTKQGLAHDTVNTLYEDRQGGVWIGTRGGGASRYKDGRFTTYSTKNGLSDNLVFSFHEDEAGSLWIGTYGGGLNRLKDGRLSAITTKQGLFDDVIHRIIEDRDDVWMSCNKGVFRVAKRELDEVADGKRERVHSIAYGTADGMKSAECNGGSPAGIRARDGKLWFPTTRGAVHVDPAHLPTNPLRPPVVIEDVRVDERVADRFAPLRLPPGTQTLEIQYTALSLAAPASVRFRYRLEGYEPAWVEAGTRRTAYYTRLPAGSYRFRVIACNNDGLWNEQGAALAFRVEPRVYETGWFRILAVLLFALAGPLFHRFRVRRLERQKAELERLVAARTAEVGAANAELARLAREDAVTGVANRRALDDTLDEEWRRAQRLHTPLSVILLDIDYFKALNDLQGHQAGDACLRAVAQAVADAHRRAGELVARYGGEELAVVLPGTSSEDAGRAAERLRRRVQDLAFPHPRSEAAPVVTVSAGVASRVPDAAESPSELVAAADRALYLAKERGRNRVEVSLPA
jgi:diguanylate cyclase (GGDEF)-like protein